MKKKLAVKPKKVKKVDTTATDIPAEERQSDINDRFGNALIEHERRIKQLFAIVAELQKLTTAIAPQTQSQMSTLQEITGNLSNLK